MADGDGDGEIDGMGKVWMRVWDDANMDGEYGSWTFYDNPENDHDYCEFNDNYNETWVYVTVEDKSPESLICPPDITIPCHWDYTDLSVTGEASVSASCTHPHVAHLDWPEIHCGEGYVLREWFVDSNQNGEMDSDEGEYPCVQRITIEYVDSPLEVVCPTFQDFEDISTNPDLTWFDPFNPNHVAVDCEDFEFPEPWQSGGKCNLIGVSSTIDTFWFEEDACFKAIKSWSYVDWCNGTEAFCEFTVSLIDTEAPEIVCQDTCIAVDDYWDVDEDGLYCELINDIDVHTMATDSGNCGSEWIKWVAEVDLWSDGIVDLTYSSFLQHSDPFYLAPTMTGSEVSLELDKDDISSAWAIHEIEWKAFDGCGNLSQCSQKIEISDKKAPTPYCVGISTALMSEEAGNLIELWASDFNVGSFDNCTPQDWLGYTFYEVPPLRSLIDTEHCFRPVWDDQANCIPLRDSETGYILSEEVNNCNGYENGAQDPNCSLDAVQKWSPNDIDADGNPLKTSSMKFKGTDWCGENDTRISVWDAKMNMDFCLVNLVIQGASCPDNGLPKSQIAGIIKTETGDEIEQTHVTNSSSVIVGGSMSMNTSSDGLFYFEQLLNGGNYGIEAKRNDNYLNGVSTLDLVLIQKHILGVSVLDSGYKLVAADVNNDEQVSAIDLVDLRKLILGVYTELPKNDSWRFVAADHILNEAAPWPLIEKVNIDNLQQDMMQQDFVGIKIGDVNNTAIANITTVTTDTRSSSKLKLTYDTSNEGSIIVKAGDNFSNIYGFQFTIRGNGDLDAIVPGVLDVNDTNFGLLNNRIITASFSSERPISFTEGEALFTLKGISDLTLLEEGFTNAESYRGESLEIEGIELKETEDEYLGYDLAQNKPNPFSEVTEIKFSLPKAAPVTFSVYDVEGKLIKVISGYYEAGTHYIQLSKDDLNVGPGVLSYKFVSDEFVRSRRMIFVP